MQGARRRGSRRANSFTAQSKSLAVPSRSGQILIPDIGPCIPHHSWAPPMEQAGISRCGVRAVAKPLSAPGVANPKCGVRCVCCPPWICRVPPLLHSEVNAHPEHPPSRSPARGERPSKMAMGLRPEYHNN